MKQLGGFQLVLIAVILAGIGVFAFSLFDPAPAPVPPVRSTIQTAPPAADARQAPVESGASEQPIGAADDPGDAPTTTHPNVASGVVPDAAPTPAEPAPSVADRRIDPPPPPPLRSALAHKPPANERQDAPDRSSAPDFRDDGAASNAGGEQRAPLQSDPQASGAVAAAPAAVGSIAVFPGSAAPTSASGPTKPASPALGADEGVAEIDDEPLFQGQEPEGGDPASPPSPSQPEQDEDPIAHDEPTPVVWLDLPPTELGVGERFAVVVKIRDATDVGHVPFHVAYDPAILRFESGEEGPFLRSDGGQTAFFAAPTSNAGSVVVGLSRLGRVPGVSGGGDLCTLHFEAVGPGTTLLVFQREKVRKADHSIVNASFERASLVVR